MLKNFIILKNSSNLFFFNTFSNFIKSILNRTVYSWSYSSVVVFENFFLNKLPRTSLPSKSYLNDSSSFYTLFTSETLLSLFFAILYIFI